MGEALPIQHTFAEWRQIWETLTGGRILDPDGFRVEKGDDLTHIDTQRVYTVEEFRAGLMQCTIRRGDI